MVVWAGARRGAGAAGRGGGDAAARRALKGLGTFCISSSGTASLSSMRMISWSPILPIDFQSTSMMSGLPIWSLKNFTMGA